MRAGFEGRQHLNDYAAWLRVMGYPDVFYLLYIVKIGLYILGGLGFALATKGIDGWGSITTWWSEPIVFQKVVLWPYCSRCSVSGAGSVR